MFGLSLPIVQQVPGQVAAWEAAAGGEEILQIALAAERLGFEYVTCSDHVLVAASRAAAMGATWYEPAATLAFVAGATRRLRLLTHVLVLPYRHPLITAKTYATLDRLSGGRVILGIGVGHATPEFRILGVSFEERGTTTDESIGAIRAAWRDEVASFEGRRIAFHDVIVSPRPWQAGGPPIWVGGNGAHALRRAAELGEGWIPWRIGVDEFAAAVARGRTLREQQGRTGRFDWVAPLRVADGMTRGEACEQIGRWKDAGATGFHVGIEGRDLAAYLGRLEWFAREVAARVG